MQNGDVVGERFVLERLAGTGGMGTVFRATDRETGQPVAVKVLAQHDAEAIHRFDHEAHTLAELGHPYIVRYVAHGATEQGTPYLVMEWLEGESLAARLARGRLSVDETLAIATRIASALAAAHARKIVHRDIKPSNVFLVGGDPEATKVLDFGLAQAAPGGARLTRTGSVLGTPGYMAPEQAQGSRGRVNPRADVFSLGALLFECLTGRAAYQGEGVMTILARLLFEDAPRVRSLRPDVPEPLDDLVARMLSRAPEARPEGGAEVLHALEAIGAPPPRRKSSGPPPLEPIGDRELRLVFAILAAPITQAAPGPSSPTLRTELPRASWEELRRLAARQGAKVSELSSGALLLLVEYGADMAVRAARLSLATADLLPDFRVSLVPGRSLVASDLLASEILERAILLLERPRQTAAGPRVQIDDAMDALLDARFEVHRAGGEGELVGEREGLGDPRPLLDHPSPFVGRAREKRGLVELFEEGFEEKRPAAALVIARAGFGKSRLAWEVVHALSAAREGLVVGVGRPDAAGAPYGVFASVIRSMAGAPLGAPLEERRLRIVEFAASVAAPSPELVASFVLEMGERAPSSARRGAEVRGMLEEFMRAAARAREILLVLEDVDFADAPSLSLVEDLLSEPEPKALAVLAVATPSPHELDPGPFTRRGFSEMRLGALPDKAARELAQGAQSASVPGVDVSSIIQRAGGSPFFLEQLFRAAALGRDGLPHETWLAVHGPELAELAPEARRVLRAASLVGASFWHGAVLVVLGDIERGRELSRTLEGLAARGIIEKRRESRVEDEIEYTFCRPSLREALLATLTNEDLRRGHALAELWLARSGVREKEGLLDEMGVSVKRRGAKRS